MELGIEAELLSGTMAASGNGTSGHVWVRFRIDDGEYIFETASKSRERMVRPFEEARAEYIPYAGVDHQLRSYGYFGYLRIVERTAPDGPLGGRRSP